MRVRQSSRNSKPMPQTCDARKRRKISPPTTLDTRKKVAEPKEFRARQNVILELGYFVGKLGRAHTFALVEKGVALPSDIHGVVYIPLDNGHWRLQLVQELKSRRAYRSTQTAYLYESREYPAVKRTIKCVAGPIAHRATCSACIARICALVALLSRGFLKHLKRSGSRVRSLCPFTAWIA